MREWHFHLDDMVEFAERSPAHTSDLDQAAFEADRLVYDATPRNLELIGEAATHVPDAVRAAHPAVPWRRILATRNRLIHGYPGIDNDTIFRILRDDLPTLVRGLTRLRDGWVR